MLMANFLTALFGGTKHDRDMKHLAPIIKKINDEESWAKGLSAEDFKKQTETWKKEVKEGRSLDEILPKAYALAREAAYRTIGERHYDVQLMGAATLHEGKIMELKTGEGKTLACVPAAYLNALEGEGVHIVTVNDYLARRDAEWMAPIYEYLGMRVGVITSDMDTSAKRENYSADVTYGTNNEFGFDYLRDNMKASFADKIQAKHHYAIVDEIDSILIDEARTPLIISGQGEDDTPKVRAADSIVPLLKECEKDPETGSYYELTEMEKLDRQTALNFDEKGDYKIDEKEKKVTFTKQGMTHMEELLKKTGALLPRARSLCDAGGTGPPSVREGCRLPCKRRTGADCRRVHRSCPSGKKVFGWTSSGD